MRVSAVQQGSVDPLFDPTALPELGNQRTSESPRRRIIVIGAGPGGIIAAYRFRRAGFDEVTVLERAAGPGGTWWHNRYPGAACDVQAHLYSFSFAPNPSWSRPYATQPELLAYFERVVDDFDLRGCMRFGVTVHSVERDDVANVWVVTTTDGERIEAEVVVSAVGMFNELTWPSIDGLESFVGPSFHTAQWPEALDVAEKRVGVIGSAATAVQLVPVIAKQVSHLTVFQRSAPWVMPKLDEPFTDEQRERFAADESQRLEIRRLLWDRVEGAILFHPASVEISTNAGISNLDSIDDPELRQKLTPQDPFGCNRPLTSSDYYPAFNLDTVDLVTTPIKEVKPNSVVDADGVEHELDVLVIATGFAATRYLSALSVTGREGVRLEDEWNDGAQAWLGIATTGFPNLFQLYGPNTNNGSILYMLECQVDLIVRTLQTMDRQNLAWVDVRREVLDEYNVEVQQAIAEVEPWTSDCSNYYRSPTGRVVTQCPFGMADYRERTLAVSDAVWHSAPLV
ncbi:MAG: NAD(P)/FAD-dependent oxidoreductase [Acidimicrobiales bacterium]